MHKSLESKALSKAGMQTDSTVLEQHVVNVRTHIHAMTEDPSNKERLYVTNEDIVKLASIGRDTVFAVTAPQGTSLIVPDPDKTAPGQPPQYRWAASGPALGSSFPHAFCNLSLEEEGLPGCLIIGLGLAMCAQAKP